MVRGAGRAGVWRGDRSPARRVPARRAPPRVRRMSRGMREQAAAIVRRRFGVRARRGVSRRCARLGRARLLARRVRERRGLRRGRVRPRALLRSGGSLRDDPCEGRLRVTRALLALAMIAGCGAPHSETQMSSARPCTSNEDCGSIDLECAPPGTPICGGADVAPVGACPPDRPYQLRYDCPGRCVAELPPQCAEGHVCPHGGVCRPYDPARDSRGCVHLACASDADCSGGRCVTGRCFDAPGECRERAVAAEEPSPEPSCPEGTYEVERCITGGMPIQTPQGPRDRGGCTMQCEPQPPAGTPGMPCAQIDDAGRRFRCLGLVPGRPPPPR